MNQLPLEKRTQIISLMVEGNSLRAISRITGTSINTITKLLVDVGRACAKYHNEMVVNLDCKRVQCDEIWSFVYSKEKNIPDGKENEAGDVWTWVGIDADTKLVITYYVGSRTAECAEKFIQDIKDRINNRIQLTSDGLKFYIKAVDKAFGQDIDFAQLVKVYGNDDYINSNEKKYSPPECNGTKKNRISGDPDIAHVSTSYIERQNLTMRMHMRRFTRLTNAFSKKIENHFMAIAIHYVYYNFAKVHSSIKTTPAIAAGLTNKKMSIEEIVKLTELYSN